MTAQDSAETIALRALAWLLSDDDLRGVFLGATGATEADLRARAAEPEFLASVLDFLVMDDAWVLRFCTDNGLQPTEPMLARAALPGGESMHWT